MVSTLASLLLPNLNLATAGVGILLIVLGLLSVYGAISLVVVPGIAKILNSLGIFLIIAGVVWWFGLSLIQDLLADEMLTAIVIAFIVVILVGVGLFSAPKKKNDLKVKRKKRRRR